MPYTFVVMPTAARQVRAIVAWWLVHRPSASVRVDQELADAAARLASHPSLGVRAAGRSLRRLLLPVTGYVVTYRIRPRAQRIEIVAVTRAR